jgi:hypothetical protein
LERDRKSVLELESLDVVEMMGCERVERVTERRNQVCGLSARKDEPRRATPPAARPRVPHRATRCLTESKERPAATREPAPGEPTNQRKAAPATQTPPCARWLAPPEEGSLVAPPEIPACPIAVDGSSAKQPGRPMATSTSHMSRQRRQDRNAPTAVASANPDPSRTQRRESHGPQSTGSQNRRRFGPPAKNAAPKPTQQKPRRHAGCLAPSVNINTSARTGQAGNVRSMTHGDVPSGPVHVR